MSQQHFQSSIVEKKSLEIIPTIGFLTESLKSVYQSNIWIGASDASNRLGYSLVCFAGGSLGNSPWGKFEYQRNAIYNFIDKSLLKGMVISSSLGNFIDADECKDFYDQFIDIALVCLGPEIPSVPTVIVDNTHGMRELISHLVENHGCRHIAFIRGPEGNQEAEERLRIFHEVLFEHDLSADPQLILNGDFSPEAGIRAAKHLTKNNFNFDAVVAANDDMALGAMKAFQEHNVRVPDDVLVVGFDDIEESRFSAPPLTTIKQPLYEMGGKAIEVIHDILRGNKIENSIIVPASLVTRHSCGCFRHDKIDGNLFEKQKSQLNTKYLQNKIKKVIRPYQTLSNEASVDPLINDLANSFVNALQNSSEQRFLQDIEKTAWNIACSGGDTIGLFHILNVLRQFAVSSFGGVLSDTVEGILHNAYIAISDNSIRAQVNRRLASEHQTTMLRSAGQAIASAFDIDHLLEVIATELANLNIDGCYLSIYDHNNNERWPSHLHLFLAIRDGNKILVDTSNNSFSTPHLAPEGIIEKEEPYSFLIEPLFFMDEQIGLIIFDVRLCRDGLTYEILQQHISSALKGALLMKQVQEQTEELKKHRDSEHAYLEAIKRELALGREIQTSFLPREIPKLQNMEVVAAFQPTGEISGDFYDLFTLPDGRLVMIICDVSEKDLSAALFMTLIRTLIRALAEQALAGAVNPLDAVGITNNYLINHHYGDSVRHMYATLFMAIFDPQTNSINYINAGHNPAALLTNTGEIRMRLDRTGPAIGVSEADFDQKSFEIMSEEILLLYSDGITEARTPEGLLFSQKRLSDLLTQPAASATELINRIESAIKTHTAGTQQSHDITMLGIRKTK